MKNYQDSDYALNKHSKGIVYDFADGAVEITLEAYLLENPGKTELDFMELKALSDSMYLEQDRSDYNVTHKNISIHGLEETNACAVVSSEEIVIDHSYKTKRRNRRRNIGYQALKKLTGVQRRRYLMYHVSGLTMRKIAEIEGTVHNAIQKSLILADKKINLFLLQQEKRVYKT